MRWRRFVAHLSQLQSIYALKSSKNLPIGEMCKILKNHPVRILVETTIDTKRFTSNRPVTKETCTAAKGHAEEEKSIGWRRYGRE